METDGQIQLSVAVRLVAAVALLKRICNKGNHLARVTMADSASTSGANSADVTITRDDDGDEIQIPERQYGYRETPFAWDELVQVILVEQDLAKLSRSEVQQREYELFRRGIDQEWKSIYDYILHSKFGFEKWSISMVDNCIPSRNQSLIAPSTTSPMTPTVVPQKWSAYPPLESVKEIRKALLPNDFPYCTKPEIVHYILWKTLESVTDEEIKLARTELANLVGEGKKVVDILHWKNPPALQSLPGIDHVHFLCLLKTDRGDESP
jgi:hypothetical protein